MGSLAVGGLVLWVLFDSSIGGIPMSFFLLWYGVRTLILPLLAAFSIWMLIVEPLWDYLGAE